MSTPTDLPSAITVSLNGSLSVAAVEEARSRLVAALDAAATVIVDLAGVTAVDVFGLQLLHAAQRSAGARGKRMELQHAGAVLRDACAAAAIAPAAVGLTEATLSP